jgi:hypothetical protein
MNHNTSIRAGRMVSIAAALAALCALMAIWNTSSAHAEQYCWGVNLPSQGATCHMNHERWASETRGMGAQHSVCVWHQPFGPIRCSSGPGAWVFNGLGGNYWGIPYIQDNAPGATVAYGEAF